MKIRLFTAALSIAIAAGPALADDLPGSVARASSAGSLPDGFDAQLDRREREAYRAIFADIRAANWAGAQSRIADAPESILEPVARAELYLAAGSPRVELEPLQRLLADAPGLPGATRIAALAQSRGLEMVPHIPAEQALRRLPGPSRRSFARPVGGDSAARSLVSRIRPLIVADSPREAEALIDAEGAALTSEGLTEVRQRVAWSYYLTGDDVNARRLARMARNGSGEWAAHADWVEGLAAWRQRDWPAAAEAFGSVGRRGTDAEMMAAGLYWSARAEMTAGRPEAVQGQLRTAARLAETFYGLLAAQTLGIEPTRPADALPYGWDSVENDVNARRAMALIEIGERDLADAYIRHGATIGDPREHDAWVELANRLGLAGAELWIAQHVPVAHHATARDRFPAPNFRPIGGWRVDRSLVYAHALQESNFRPDVVSPAGARGLLQLMPGTASDIARDRGETVNAARLNEPEINIEYGQFYMEQMRDFPGTQGLLPKVIASYNAGPGAVVNWQGRLRDRGDPLLYIESIPYYETRQYVPIVLRNYWMYQRNAGEETTSLEALAQGMWPRFPGSPGPVAVRLSGGGTRIAD